MRPRQIAETVVLGCPAPRADEPREDADSGDAPPIRQSVNAPMGARSVWPTRRGHRSSPVFSGGTLRRLGRPAHVFWLMGTCCKPVTLDPDNESSGLPAAAVTGRDRAEPQPPMDFTGCGGTVRPSDAPGPPKAARLPPVAAPGGSPSIRSVGVPLALAPREPSPSPAAPAA